MKTFQTHSGEILILTEEGVRMGEKLNLRGFWRAITESNLLQEEKFKTLEFLENLSKSTEDGAKGKTKQNQRETNIALRETTKGVFLNPRGGKK